MSAADAREGFYEVAAEAIRARLDYLHEWAGQEAEHYTDAEWQDMHDDLHEALSYFAAGPS